MAVTVHLIPCLEDNYGFLIRDEASGLVAAIDAPDAGAIQRELFRLRWRLTFILNTHRHADHIGGNAQLVRDQGAMVIAPEEVARLVPVDRIVAGGDHIYLGETCLEVLETPGHTLGHVSYLSGANGIVFVGDTLFAMGCGRLFEGTAQQMWASLSKLAQLPHDTKVYCAHEYTAANARFAISVDSCPVVAARARAVFDARLRGEATVPTTIGRERMTNPFLRAPDLRPELEPVEAFAEIRRAKDKFGG